MMNWIIKNGILEKFTGYNGSAVIPEEVNEIGSHAFSNCRNLTITFPENIITIDNNAFYNCQYITLIFMSNSLHYDIKALFNKKDFPLIYAPNMSLKEFKDMKLKNNVVLCFLQHLPDADSIKESCKNEYIKYLKNHKETRKAAYEQALALNGEPILHFLLKNQIVPSNEYDFLLNRANTLHRLAAASMLESYFPSTDTKKVSNSETVVVSSKKTSKNDLNKEWKTKKREDGTLEINGYNGHQINIEIPSSIGNLQVTSIGAYALSPYKKTCQNSLTYQLMKSVHIPEGIIKIDNHAFDGCAGLTHIRIPNSVTEIGDSVFATCTNMTEISIPSTISKIGVNPFEFFRSLEKSPNGTVIIRRTKDMLRHSVHEMIGYMKYQNLDVYAEEHHCDFMQIIFSFETALGLDGNASKEYYLGNKIVKLTLTPDLKVSLWDNTFQKGIRTLPEKEADPLLFDLAAADLKSIRTSIKYFTQKIYDFLFQIFLNKVNIAGSLFQKFCKDSILIHSIMQAIIWEQSRNTFIISEDGFICSDGSSYAILPDQPVYMAHPMEMCTDCIESWQKYFIVHKITQPFTQIWEPIVDFSTLEEDRYNGILLKHSYFLHQKKRGIESKFPNSSIYDSYIHFKDCTCDIFVDWETVDIIRFCPTKETRRSNHIISYLNRITIREKILKDDVTIETFLPGFTLAQIADFIKLATEKGCPNVTSLLLNYKNEHFADFDPMEEFTLGEL